MAFSRVLLLVVVALISACAGQSKKSTDDTTEVEQPVTDVKDGQPIQKIPNPYLQQEQKAPAAAVAQYRQALVAMQAEDWSTAKRTLTELVTNHPDLSGPHVNLGIVAWRQNKLDDAESEFKQAIKVNALNNDAYNQLGLLQREQGRFKDAEQTYLKALQVWPHAPVTLRNLGILYDLYMGKLNEALAKYELALKVLPEPDVQLQGWIIDLRRRLAN